MVFTRGGTAKDRLKISWDTPIWRPNPRGQGTGSADGPLPADRAFAFVRGKDPRPLLILRECHLCTGSDAALLDKAADNERTMLLTGWFHCVRLPATVTEKQHRLHALFADKGKAHLYFATHDGKTTATLPGRQAQAELWKTMTGILRQSYKGNPDNAVRQLLALLNEFDALDSEQAELRRRLDSEVERNGPKSSTFKRLHAKFRQTEEERKRLLAREKKLRNLGIRP